MIRWIPYTFVRTVLFFIGGILLGVNIPDLIPEKTSFLLAGIMTSLYFLIVFAGRHFRHTLNPGWIALFLVMLLGYIHVVLQTESRDPGHLIHNRDKVSHYKAIITRFAEEKERSWKMEARILEIYTDTWVVNTGKVVLYFSKEGFPRPFQYGDVLLVKGQPQRPEASANPGEFDYREFLASKNIYHQHFLRGGEVAKTGNAPPSRFKAFAFRGRAWAETVLQEFVRGHHEQAVASALVLGVTDGLDNELRNAYAATGAMHILAVSGLHVSILYLILLWIMKPFNRFPGGRWVVAFAALLMLWLYASVTGLSPSVLRAVTMFSFLALARPWARSTNIYNTLAVSAFCLLLVDPSLVRSVGFQLSYFAVLGIVYLYPRILVLWEPNHSLTAKIWKITTVSVAAQIATFALGLLYFHQFPNYFLLSNLLVVPLASVVLVLGLLVLGASLVPPLATAIGFCLELTLRFLNNVVFTLEGFPFSLTKNVYISVWQCGLIIVFIMVVLALIRYRKFSYMIAAFLTVAAFSCLQWLHFSREVNVQKIAVYKVPGHSVIDFMDRGQTFFLTDSILSRDLQKIRYHITPNRLIAGVDKISTGMPVMLSLHGCRLLAWNGRTILQVTDRDFRLPGALTVDWVVIANNALPDIRKISDGIIFKKVILDSSNSYFFATRFLEGAKLYKLNVHSVLHEGAFIEEIENQDS